MSAISILGAGTWAIALARMLANSGHAVTVRSAIPAEIDTLFLLFYNVSATLLSCLARSQIILHASVQSLKGI